MGVKRFQDLIAWQLARQLRRELRTIIQKPSIAKDFDFTNQVKAAARSATSNIAEGFPCSHAEFARFLEISARSLCEIEDRLIEAVDERLLSQADVATAFNLQKRAATAVAGLMAYLRRTPDPPSYKPTPPKKRSPRRPRCN